MGERLRGSRFPAQNKSPRLDTQYGASISGNRILCRTITPPSRFRWQTGEFWSFKSMLLRRASWTKKSTRCTTCALTGTRPGYEAIKLMAGC